MPSNEVVIMCDTFIALGNATASKSAILGKNSDREPNEAQEILHVPAVSHETSLVQCTYIQIPQVSHTYEVILSKPFQMWGAEMGCNEHGVAIGNEAIFTNVKKAKSNSGLTGMDVLRLSLERSKDAEEALKVCTSLIEKYGQDACGGYQDQSFYYDNSFIIADGVTAWKLETAGRSWAAKRIVGFDSISNGISITDDYDDIYVDGSSHSSPDKSTSFRRQYGEQLMDTMTRWKSRQACTIGPLKKHKGSIDLSLAIAILKTHEKSQDQFKPHSSTARSVCMHASGFLNPSQTTGSMVVEWNKNGSPTVWLTGTSMPCLSIYKPFFFQAPIKMITPSSSPDASLWWKAERLHRWIAADYQNRRLSYSSLCKELQQKMFNEIGASWEERNKRDFSQRCWEEHLALIKRYTAENNIKDLTPKSFFHPLYRYFWNKQNELFA
jgi:dipeptidase